MKRTIIITFTVLLMTVYSQENTPKKQSDITKIAMSYQSLNKMTKEPVYINPEISMLCTGFTQKEIQKSNPHSDTAVHMYMNDIAKKAFLKKEKKYPEGSIIVKDKNALSFHKEIKKNKDGVGGMVKRQKGFDTKNGDWEYFYFIDLKNIESGKIESCIKCHSKTPNTDYVYGTWYKK